LLLFAVHYDSPRCKFQRDLSIGVVWRSIAQHCVRQACNSPTTKNHRAGKNVAAVSSSETGERREENNGNSRSISRTLLGRQENRSRSDKAVYLRRNNRRTRRLDITLTRKSSSTISLTILYLHVQFGLSLIGFNLLRFLLVAYVKRLRSQKGVLMRTIASRKLSACFSFA
jgi:hypothetical protein